MSSLRVYRDCFWTAAAIELCSSARLALGFPTQVGAASSWVRPPSPYGCLVRWLHLNLLHGNQARVVIVSSA